MLATMQWRSGGPDGEEEGGSVGSVGVLPGAPARAAAAELAAVRSKLKSWERRFLETKGRKPESKDIPSDMAQLYQRYRRLKKKQTAATTAATTATTTSKAASSRPGKGGGRVPATPTQPREKPTAKAKQRTRFRRDMHSASSRRLPTLWSAKHRPNPQPAQPAQPAAPEGRATPSAAHASPPPARATPAAARARPSATRNTQPPAAQPAPAPAQATAQSPAAPVSMDETVEEVWGNTKARARAAPPTVQAEEEDDDWDDDLLLDFDLGPDNKPILSRTDGWAALPEPPAVLGAEPDPTPRLREAGSVPGSGPAAPSSPLPFNRKRRRTHLASAAASVVTAETAAPSPGLVPSAASGLVLLSADKTGSTGQGPPAADAAEDGEGDMQTSDAATDTKPAAPSAKGQKGVVAWDNYLTTSFGFTADTQTRGRSVRGGLVTNNFRRLNLRNKGVRSKYTKAYKRKNHKHYVRPGATCHSCGDVGHFAADCPLSRPFSQVDQEEELEMDGWAEEAGAKPGPEGEGEGGGDAAAAGEEEPEEFSEVTKCRQVDTMKVAELRARMTALGLDSVGTKKLLAQRFKAHLGLGLQSKTAKKGRKKRKQGKGKKQTKARKRARKGTADTDSDDGEEHELDGDEEDGASGSEAADVEEEDEAVAAADWDSPESLCSALKDLYGFSKFRPGQKETIERILAGKSTLLILSTGSGKSLCYQLPMFMLRERKKQARAMCIVVSPLLSLIADQIQRLPKKLKAATLNSGMTKAEKTKVKQRVDKGDIHLLFIAPETLVSGSFRRLMRQSKAVVELCCVDEAHCVSEWSHNFRFAYLRIGSVLRDLFPHNPPVLALTATATPRTEASIVQSLGLPADGIIKGAPIPNNLQLSVSDPGDDRKQALFNFLRKIKGPSIVYCTRQIDTEDIAQYLRTKGFPNTDSYHGGKSPRERKAVQNKFMANKLRTVVATIAFGMGLDKPDVRAVVHYQFPKSGEGYVQEIGRAGRDGKQARCRLFLNDDDLAVLKGHAHGDALDEVCVRWLVRRLFSPSAETVAAEEAAVQAAAATDQGEQLLAGKRSGCRNRIAAVTPEEAAEKFDMKETVLMTFLCWLEAMENPHLRLLYSPRCICRFTVKAPEFAKEDCIMAALVAGSHRCVVGRIWEREIDLTLLANAVGLDFQDVVRCIKSLQEGAKIGMDLYNPATVLELIRPPSVDQIAGTVDYLCSKMYTLERSQLRKLDRLHGIMRQAIDTAAAAAAGAASQAAAAGEGSEGTESEPQVPETPAAQMDAVIRAGLVEYFEDQQEEDVLKQDTAVDLSAYDASEVQDLRRAVRAFIDKVSGQDGPPDSGRAIARIFHGIDSPKYPRWVWNKQREWRRYIQADFHLIRTLGTEQILRYRLGKA